jgi:hypothetical protein
MHRAGVGRWACAVASREDSRRWREANRERHRELNRRWREANPEKVREQNTRRLERLAAASEPDGCWLWDGPMQAKGYGQVRERRVHRLAWEHWVGSIPEGAHLHHRCGVKACFNPRHLETLTPDEHRARHNEELLHES